MKIVIEEPRDNEEEEIIVRCHSISPRLMQLLSALTSPEVLIAYKNQEIHKIDPDDVYYFETVDNKTFLYTQSQVLESKQRLYELEEELDENFQRISKSVLLNMMKVQSLRPALNGRFEARLNNGETVIVSRQYVASMKEKFGI